MLMCLILGCMELWAWDMLGKFLFKYRSFTPVPFFLFLLYFSKPNLKWISIGICLLIIGEFIRINSVSYLGRDSRTNVIFAKELVTTGPYAVVRNPIYLGNFFIGLGIIFILGVKISLTALLYLVGFIIQYIAIIHEEEKYLKNKFGEIYLNYKKNVPCIIPKFTSLFKLRIRWTKLFSKETFKTEKDTLLVLSLAMLFIGLKWIFIN